MQYFYVKEIENDYEHLFEYKGNEKIKVDDVVVIPNFQDLPVTAFVTKIVGKYQAHTSKYEREEIIDIVNIKEWNAKRLKEIDNKVMLEKMQSKISEIKMLEQLEKYAGKDPEMLELLNEYKGQGSIYTETEDDLPFE
ncbi:hypothetical protein G7059_03750 [Erysipelothrix sp. HDW6A]|uniref:hypothetical protein n=1 Tax=Erysipelothrix sp. HDW6A TaxID=2714928 RepID=UPI001408763C|nr:hypothetical protein [Erysipelothrix sp. HDW6A]QIK57026.1 hypothetical protein G7059_03750 [Erysipelothrix sp. HDW6A]